MNSKNKNKSRIIFAIVIILLVLLAYIFLQLKPLDQNLPELANDSATKSANPFSGVDGVECIPDISSYEIATLLNVIDGDSIKVSIRGNQYEVRYIGMNSPEYYSDERDAAVKATQFNKELLGFSELYLFKDVSETDKYDRLLRYVIANGKFINLELVRFGYAEAKTYRPDVSCQNIINNVFEN